MLYSEFCALTDAARHADVELSYKNRFTDFEFSIKATPAVNGDSWLWVICTNCEDSVQAMLESFDIEYYCPVPGKFLFIH